MEPYEKIAKILRTDKDMVLAAAKNLSLTVGHDDAILRIVNENERIMADRLSQLGISSKKADDMFFGLISKIKQDDEALAKHVGCISCADEHACGTLLSSARALANVSKGFFLKTEKALEFLRKEPPPHTMSFFQASHVDKLFERFSVYELYAALRFIEDKQWLNEIFFKQLERVTPDDFEEREIEVHVLHKAWLDVAASFLKKKYHNVSHLKELGVIFVIPLDVSGAGGIMRLFSLILHYLHEVDFYSNVFRMFSAEKDTFARRLISALRGDVLDERFAGIESGSRWMIVQRYLAKEDENDWRLFEPHVNPEAIHWSKAERDIARLGTQFPALELTFWNELDYVGDFFPDGSGVEVLVSFNLIDTVMSLVQEKDMIKYLYHHQEALWNKLFSEYVGADRMEDLIIRNFEKGYIDGGSLAA